MLFELHEEQAAATSSRRSPRFVSELVDRWKLPARVAIEGDLDAVPTAVLETAHSDRR